MRTHQQQAARRRPMCQVRVTERERERVVALAHGDHEGPFNVGVLFSASVLWTVARAISLSASSCATLFFFLYRTASKS